jgi:sulfonate transport system permease protein
MSAAASVAPDTIPVADRPKARWLHRLAGPISIIVVLIGWELVARAMAGSYILAGPLAIIAYLSANAGLMSRALLTTLEAAAWGFLWGNLAAIALAVLALMVPRLQGLVSGLALVFFCLPLVATGPILRVLFGTGTGPQITLAALAVYYTTYLCLMVGLRAAPASWFDLVRSYGRGRLTELLRIRIFATLPYFIAGLQIAAPAAFLGAMVGEFTGAERGMGVLAIRAMRGLDVEATWALASLAAAVSMLAFWALGWLGRRLGAAPPALLLTPPAGGKPLTAPRLALSLLGLSAVTIAVIWLIWTGTMEGFGLNRFFAKRPGDVFAFLFTDASAATNRATLLAAFAQTLSLAVPGYVLGLALGAGLAAAMVLVPTLSATTLPVAIALRSVPIITTAPLITMALGRGAAGTITIVAVMIFFPTLVACLEGMRRTPGQVLDIFESYAASPWRRLVGAQVPAMLPAFFASARMAVPAAFLAATTAEWLATGSGIGALMAMTASTSAYGMLWSAIVLLALTASLLYLAAGQLERLVLSRFASEQLAK